jgi:hypothetical protein
MLRVILNGIRQYLHRRFSSHPGGARQLQLIERIRISPDTVVALIEASGQQLLVASSKTGATFFELREGRPCEAILKDLPGSEMK